MRQPATGSAKSETRRSFLLILFATTSLATNDLPAEGKERPASREAAEMDRPANRRQSQGIHLIDQPLDKVDHPVARRLDRRDDERSVRGAPLNLTTDILEDDLPLQDEDAPAVDRRNRATSHSTSLALS